MARLKSKGIAFLQEISSVYTAIVQVKSLDKTGEKSETTEGTSLEQSNGYKIKDPTGYIDTPTIKLEVYFDPALASHAAFIALIAAPVATNFKITYTNSGPTSKIYSGTGFGYDDKASPSENISGTFTIETSGAPA